jgi:predicted dehydrogenase
MTEPVRIAVVGAGIMGANHARVARNLRDATLTAVVDADLERAARVAGPGVRVAGTVDEIIDDCDLAVVAVPTALHYDVTMTLLSAGKHVLVEKPIASTQAQATDMVAEASRRGLVLAVGHIERFNAAVAELPPLLDQPLVVTARRVSPYSPRISDGVIHDLMIHDLDIVLSLVGPDAKVQAVSGAGRAVHGGLEDLACVTVSFDTGLVALFETNRVSQEKVRRVEVTQAESVVVADLLRQDITVHRMSRHEYLADDGVRYRQSSVVEIPFIEQRGEPLARELQNVVDAVRQGVPPKVTGVAGQRALALADLVAEAVVRT